MLHILSSLLLFLPPPQNNTLQDLRGEKKEIEPFGRVFKPCSLLNCQAVSLHWCISTLCDWCPFHPASLLSAQDFFIFAFVPVLGIEPRTSPKELYRLSTLLCLWNFHTTLFRRMQIKHLQIVSRKKIYFQTILSCHNLPFIKDRNKDYILIRWSACLFLHSVDSHLNIWYFQMQISFNIFHCWSMFSSYDHQCWKQWFT